MTCGAVVVAGNQLCQRIETTAKLRIKRPIDGISLSVDGSRLGIRLCEILHGDQGVGGLGGRGSLPAPEAAGSGRYLIRGCSGSACVPAHAGPS